MKKAFIFQKSQSVPEMINWRSKGIGGSDAPAIMNTSPWSNPLKVWELKTGRRDSDPVNFQMRRGLRLEPIAREEYQQMTGIEMPAKRVQNLDVGFARASLDGLNLKVEKGLEIKCPGRLDHAFARHGKIPEKYIFQLVHICFAGDIDVIDYFSFDGKKGVIVPFERNKKLEEKLINQERKFWECVKNDTPPNRKEVSMSIKTKGPYTAREVSEILQLAKKLGANRIRLDGFEADFDLGISEISEENSHSDWEEGPPCSQCGNPKTMGPFKHFYCKPCYIASKNPRNGSMFQTRKSRR